MKALKAQHLHLSNLTTKKVSIQEFSVTQYTKTEICWQQVTAKNSTVSLLLMLDSRSCYSKLNCWWLGIYFPLSHILIVLTSRKRSLYSSFWSSVSWPSLPNSRFLLLWLRTDGVFKADIVFEEQKQLHSSLPAPNPSVPSKEKLPRQVPQWCN